MEHDALSKRKEIISINMFWKEFHLHLWCGFYTMVHITSVFTVNKTSLVIYATCMTEHAVVTFPCYLAR